jgi:hypothetical protein
MGVVLNALTHVAIGAGSVVGVAIRLGHGEVSCSGPKPRIEIATPIRRIPVVDAANVGSAVLPLHRTVRTDVEGCRGRNHAVVESLQRSQVLPR